MRSQKPFTAHSEGVIPLSEEIVKKHGFNAAIVYWIVCQYCEMETGRCFASQETLADDIGFSRQTVNKYLQILVNDGYLIVYQKLANGNIYADSGKVHLVIDKSVNEVDRKDVGESELQDVTPIMDKSVNGRHYQDGSTVQGKSVNGVDKSVSEIDKSAVKSTDTIKLNTIKLNPNKALFLAKSKDLSKNRVRSTRPRDRRFSHSGVLVYKDVTGLHPNRVNLDTIIIALGEDPDPERVKNAYARWCSLGFNPANMDWMQWYKNGIPEKYLPKEAPRKKYRHADGLEYWHYQDGREELIDKWEDNTKKVIEENRGAWEELGGGK